MNAKEYLLRIKKAECLIKNKREQINCLRNTLQYRGVSYDNPGVQGGLRQTEADLISKVVDFEQEVLNEIKTLIDLKKEIMGFVDQIDDPNLVDLLYRRYFMFQTWEKVAEEQRISIRQVHRRHGEALKKLQNILDKSFNVTQEL